MVKQGYKQTEIGVIPEDWKINIFKNVGNFFKGAGISMKDVKPIGLPCIMYGDIYVKFDTHFIKCDFKIDEKTARGSTKAITNDLFFTASGETAEEIGKCVSYQGQEDIYIGGDIIAIRPYENYNSLFLAFVQNSSELIKQKASLAQGHTVVHINKDNLASLLFAHPTLEEQERIAEALSDIDSMIYSLEKLIAKKKAVKQGAMQELLTGKKRLPGFIGEWRKCKLKDVLTVVHGQSQHAIEDVNGKYPILATGGIIGRANSYLYDQPSVLIGRKGTIDKPQYMETPFWTIDTLFYTKISTNYHAKYIFYVFCLIDWLDYNEASGVPSLSASVIENIDVIIPELREQVAIASILCDIDNEIESLEQKLEKTHQIKQGMMQQLLTGKIRLV